jgi:hypothetical protein
MLKEAEQNEDSKEDNAQQHGPTKKMPASKCWDVSSDPIRFKENPPTKSYE